MNSSEILTGPIIRPFQLSIQPLADLLEFRRASDDYIEDQTQQSQHGGAAHDIATGAIEGGVGAVATDALIHQATEGKGNFGMRMKNAGSDIVGSFRQGERSKLLKKIGIGAAVGAGATGLIGALVAGGKKTKKAVGNARARFKEHDANSERTANGFNMEAFRAEMTELARGDMLLKRMAESRGAVNFPMKETEALVGAARKNVPQLASGLSAAGRNAGPQGMQGIRDGMAAQVREAKAGGLLGAMKRVKVKSNVEVGAAQLPAKKISESDIEAGMLKKSALGLAGSGEDNDSKLKKSMIGVKAPLSPMAANMANAYGGLGKAPRPPIPGNKANKKRQQEPAYTGYEYSAGVIDRCIIMLSQYDSVLSEKEREDKALLAVHRYTQKANDSDKDRGALNTKKATVLGALAGLAVPSKRVGKLQRAAIGAGAGLIGVKAIRSGTKLDGYGDRSWEAKRAEGYPGALAKGVILGGLIARRKSIKSAVAGAHSKAIETANRVMKGRSAAHSFDAYARSKK